jgi:Uma2 family endonuclease
MFPSMPSTPGDAAASSSRRPGAEHRFLLRGVPWTAYVALRDAVDHAGVRMTYLAGALELMSPSELHEETKSILGRLLEVWAEEHDVDLRAFGSATFRREARERGLEPDECYTLGPKEPDGAPHLAIEVVVESPLLDKLAVYAGLGVREVWTWRDEERRIVVRVLVAGRYEGRERSELLPGVDLSVLASFVRPGESHTALARAYRAATSAH